MGILCVWEGSLNMGGVCVSVYLSVFLYMYKTGVKVYVDIKFVCKCVGISDVLCGSERGYQMYMEVCVYKICIEVYMGGGCLKSDSSSSTGSGWGNQTAVFVMYSLKTPQAVLQSPSLPLPAGAPSR